MKYNREYISSLDDSIIKTWEIYESHGDGAQGGVAYHDGKTLKIIEATEFDAWIIAESMNIALNGIITKRSSWEDPTIRYKLAADQSATPY